MSDQKLKTLEELIEESSIFQRRFEQLVRRSPNDPDCALLVREIHEWLVKCIAHGRYLPGGSPERRALRTIVDAWNSRLRREGHRLDGIGDLAIFEPNAGVVLDVRCPYPGLEAYRADRSESFFGRAPLIKRYIDRLILNRILLVVGASGSGKSSLALAGVSPQLQSLRPEWIYAEDFTPGTQPLVALVSAVFGKTEEPLEQLTTVVETLRDDPTSAPVLFEGLCRGQSLFLLIDQLEELMTLCRDLAEQQAFAALLVALSEAPKKAGGWTCRILLTLRTDHLARFESNVALKPLYSRLVDEQNFDHLTALRFDDIKRAIAAPATAIGLRFIPPSIVEQLASQTAGLSKGLPLLQFALRRLWESRLLDPETEKPLDFVNQAMVDALPDVQRSLGTVAERIYLSFSLRQSEICERLLNELVLLDENFEEPLRRRRNRLELERVLLGQFPGARGDIDRVIVDFTEYGLLRIFGKEGEAQIEVSHEALLRNWERINRALSGDEAKHRLHTVKQIGREAMEWENRSRHQDFLKQQGTPLKSALSYRDNGWIADRESKDYLDACSIRDTALVSALKTRVLVKWVSAMSVLILVVFAGGVILSSLQRDANIATIASLTERLPPWEALDVAYTLAKNGGADYRFALGHALERMEDSWILGKRDSSLFLAADGAALMQFDPTLGNENLLIYPVKADGVPQTIPIRVSLKNKIDRFVQAYVGPIITEGPHKGHRIIVVTYIVAPGAPGFGVEVFLVTSLGAPVLIPVEGDMTPVMEADALSPVRIHPDGGRMIWSVLNNGKSYSSIHELRLGESDKATVNALPDPAPSAGLVTAVAYGPKLGQTSVLVTARRNGSVLCGSVILDSDEPIGVRTSDSDEPIGVRTPAVQRPVVQRITPSTDLSIFAVLRDGGNVSAASCGSNGKLHAFPFVATDATNIQVTAVNQRGTPPTTWVVTYFDVDQQLRCYEYDPAAHTNQWWLCDSSHFIGPAALMTNRGELLVMERAGVSAVRHYVGEQSSKSGKQVSARRSAGTTLRWSNLRATTSGKENDTDESPWIIEGSSLSADEKHVIEGASISSDGTHIAWIETWIERFPTLDHRKVVPDAVSGQKVSLVRSMAIGQPRPDPWLVPQEGFALAVAVDGSGGIAQVQGPNRKRKKALLILPGQRSLELEPADGDPTCMAFSPSAKYLIFGSTRGALYRMDAEASVPNPQVLSRSVAEPIRKVSVTACAISDDGGTVAGYGDGKVVYFAPDGKALLLTARAAYDFPVPIKDVQITSGLPRRVSALGEWQTSSCVHPALPGQTVRAWDLGLPARQRDTPISVACFPNEVITAIGPWSKKAETDRNDTCSDLSAGPSPASSHSRIGLCLVGAERDHWHECPACGTAADVPKSTLQAEIDKAAKKGALRLEDSDLKKRYGFTLRILP